MKKKQKYTGFSTVHVLSILVVIGILGFTGWFVYKAKNNADKAYNDAAKVSNSITSRKSKKTVAPTPAVKPKEPVNKQYTSSKGSFSFTYPDTWTLDVEADQTEEQVTVMPINPDPIIGSRIWLVFRSSAIQNSTVGNANTVLGYGDVTTLSNGRRVWRLNKTRALAADEGHGHVCTMIRAVVDSPPVHFDYPLSNGRFLTIDGSTCAYQKAVPMGTYDEQLASRDWKTMMEIMSSLQIK